MATYYLLLEDASEVLTEDGAYLLTEATLEVSYHTTILGIASLQHYWQSVEASGTSLGDSKGTLTGTAQSGVVLNATTGVDGPQPSFPGNLTTGYWSAGTTGLATGATARSLACWFRTTASQTDPNSSGYVGICGYGTGTTNQLWSLYCQTDNKTVLIGDFGTNLTWTRPASFVDGGWHYLAATYDGTTARLYFDGVQVNSKAITYATTIGANPFWVGRMIGTNGPFTGSIGEVEVYSAALSPAQVSDNFAAGIATFFGTTASTPKPATAVVQSQWASGLVRCYPFLETSGSSASDITGTANGTLIGAMTRSSGSYGQQLVAVDAGATGSALNIVNPLSGQNAFTICILAALDKLTDAPSGTNIRCLYGHGRVSANYPCVIYYSASDRTVNFTLAYSAAPQVSMTAPTLNTPELITARLTSGGEMSLWYGRVKFAARTSGGITYPTDAGSTAAAIGSDMLTLNRNWSGPLILANVFTRALSDAEIGILADDPSSTFRAAGTWTGPHYAAATEVASAWPTISVSVPAVAGDIIIVGTVTYRGNPTAVQPTVTDSAGNTYTRVSYNTGYPDCTVALFWTIAGTTATLSVTTGIVSDGHGDAILAMTVTGYRTGGITPVFEAQAGNSGSSTTTPSAGSITTAGDALLACAMNLASYQTPVAGAGWTFQAHSLLNQGQPICYEDQVGVGAGTYTGNWTTGSATGFSAVVASFILPAAVTFRGAWVRRASVLGSGVY